MQAHNSPSAAPVLPYRSAVDGGERLRRVLIELAARETLTTAGMVGKIAAGVPLCLIGPLLFSGIVQAALSELDFDRMGFWPAFLVTTAVVVPFLLWLERYTRGEFYADSLRGEETPWQAASFYEFEAQGPKLAFFGFVEIALTGPRLIWDVVDQLRGKPRLDLPARQTAAEIALELYAAGAGREFRQLARPPRTPGEVRRAIKFLASQDWVGISSRGDRVWLSSRVRAKLVGLLDTTTGTARGQDRRNHSSHPVR